MGVFIEIIKNIIIKSMYCKLFDLFKGFVDGSEIAGVISTTKQMEELTRKESAKGTVYFAIHTKENEVKGVYCPNSTLAELFDIANEIKSMTNTMFDNDENTNDEIKDEVKFYRVVFDFTSVCNCTLCEIWLSDKPMTERLLNTVLSYDRENTSLTNEERKDILEQIKYLEELILNNKWLE